MKITCTQDYSRNGNYGNVYVQVTELPDANGTYGDKWQNSKVVRYFVDGSLYHQSTTILPTTNQTAFLIQNLNLGQTYTITVVCENTSSGGIRNAVEVIRIPYHTDSGNISSEPTYDQRLRIIFGVEPRNYHRSYEVIISGVTYDRGRVEIGSAALITCEFDVPREYTAYSVMVVVKNPDDTVAWSGTTAAQSYYRREIRLGAGTQGTGYMTDLVGFVHASDGSPRFVTLIRDGETVSGQSWTVERPESISIQDTDVLPGRVYEYILKATLPDGSEIQTMPLSIGTTFTTANIDVTDVTEYSANLTLKVSEVSPYSQEIRWFYTDALNSGEIVAFGTTALPAGAETSSLNLDALASNTSYEIRADVYHGDEYTGSGWAAVTTRKMYGDLEPDDGENSIEPTTIRCRLVNFGSVTYQRPVKWYYKRKGTREWIYSGETAIPAGEFEVQKYRFQSLSYATQYDFKAEVYRGKNIVLTLYTEEKTLNADGTPDALMWIDDVLPDPIKNSRASYVLWSKTDKYDWDGYRFYIDRGIIPLGKTEPTTWYTGNIWGDNGTLKEVFSEQYNYITHAGGNLTYGYRVKAVKGTDVIYSKTFKVFIPYEGDTFQWDVPKIQGQPAVITAAEWAKFCKCIKARVAGDNMDFYKEMEQENAKALPGLPFTARIWNAAKNALLRHIEAGAYDDFQQMGLDYLKADVQPGQTITAKMMNDIVIVVTHNR